MSGSSPKSISISGVETDITIGKELAAVAQKSKALASRDCFEQLEMYLHGRSHDRVCLLFGLLQTGKNTMLRQAIGRMTKEDLSRIAYIKARRTDNMAMMNRDLKKLFNAGFRYVFIDEVTLMEDFIDSAALFSDVFATMGMKIVLSGTDSLGFWLAMDEELYDRAKSIHTTFIPYREYSGAGRGVEGLLPDGVDDRPAPRRDLRTAMERLRWGHRNAEGVPHPPQPAEGRVHRW